MIVLGPRDLYWAKHHFREFSKSFVLWPNSVEQISQRWGCYVTVMRLLCHCRVLADSVVRHHFYLILTHRQARPRLDGICLCSSSSRMRVMNHNWSATNQHLHLQSVAEISRHSVLSGDRIRQCGTSSGSHHKDTDQSPFSSAGTAVCLFRAKTVQQRPLLPREVETQLPDCLCWLLPYYVTNDVLQLSNSWLLIQQLTVILVWRCRVQVQ